MCTHVFIEVVLSCRYNHTARGDPAGCQREPCASLYPSSWNGQAQTLTPHDTFSRFSLNCMCRTSNWQFHNHSFLHSAAQGGIGERRPRWSASAPLLGLLSNSWEYNCTAWHHHWACPGQLLTSCHGMTCLDNEGCPNTDSQDLLAMILDWSVWANLPQYQILQLFYPEHPQWEWDLLLMQSDTIPPKSDIHVAQCTQKKSIVK